MKKIWFTGDTHLGHARTLELSKRAFDSVEKMDEAIISNWNKVVKANDTVYHIGDFGDYRKSEKLNGEIHLLLGNYERDDINSGAVTLEELENHYNFFKVYDETVLSLILDGLAIDLVHEPSHRNTENFTLFGHIHKLQMVKTNALNVGVDCHNFTPIDISEVLFYKEAIEKHYDDEVFRK